MASSQALELRGIEKAGIKSRAIVEEYRRTVPYLREDRLVHEDLVATVDVMQRMVLLGGSEPAAMAGMHESPRRSSAVFRKADAVEPDEAPLEAGTTFRR
jgi:hypothetical protein